MWSQLILTVFKVSCYEGFLIFDFFVTLVGRILGGNRLNLFYIVSQLQVFAGTVR